MPFVCQSVCPSVCHSVQDTLVSAPYLLNPLNNFHLNFTQMFLSVRRCAMHMTQLPRLKVTGQCQGIYPWIGVRSISPEPLGRFSLNFTQMFPSMRRCEEHMTQLPRLKVKVTVQGHVIHHSIRVCSISPESFEWFSLNFPQMFLSVST